MMRLLHHSVGRYPHLSGQFHCTGKYTSEEMSEIRQKYGEHTWFEGCTPLKQMAQHDYNLTADQSNASLAQGPISAAILAGGVAFAGHQIDFRDGSLFGHPFSPWGI